MFHLSHKPTILLVPLVIVLLAGLLFSVSARADVGVQPVLPVGSSLYPNQATPIQMASETVKINVRPAVAADNLLVELNPAAYGYDLHPVWFPGIAEVQADFMMKNPTAEPVSMTVWFPLASALKKGWNLNPDETVPRLKNFKATVNGRPAKITESDWPNPEGAGKPDLPWASFPVTFPAGKKTPIHVSYAVPLQPVPKQPAMALNYIFQTGAGWAGPIGKAKLIVNLPYPASPATLAKLPPGVALEGKKATWTWENFEPGPKNDFAAELLTPTAWQRLKGARAAARIHPKDLQAWLDLAGAYRNLSLNMLTLSQLRFAKTYLPLSLAAYQKAIKLAPEHPAPHAGIALTSLAQYLNDPNKPAALLKTAQDEYQIAKALDAQDPILMQRVGDSKDLLIWLEDRMSMVTDTAAPAAVQAATTPTPGPIPTAVPIAQSPLPVTECPGAPTIILKLEDWAMVSTTPPLPNRLRSQPTTHAETISQVQPGDKVLVADGPRCADGYTWWYVFSLDGSEGWTAEGNAAGYWLIPRLATRVTSDWQRQTPTTSPSPRKGIGMVYDLGRDVIVLAGGSDWNMVSGETWEYDGLNWRLRKDVNQFPKRAGAALAYDTDRQVTVMFGGYRLGNTPFLKDTWEYDGKKWVQKHPSQSPPARNGAVMAYDPLGKRMILFGGYGGPRKSIFFYDTWEYADGQWRQLNPTRHPPAREAAQMVYDAARGKMVLFGGGHDAGSVIFADTWEWDGENWTMRADLPVSPPARWAFLMAYDEGCQQVMLYSGLKGTVDMFVDTWAYDGETWEKARTEHQPPPRWDGGMVYDARNQRLVMFGGQYWSGSFVFLNDTWIFPGGCR